MLNIILRRADYKHRAHGLGRCVSVLTAEIERVLKGGGQRVWSAYDEYAYGCNVEER